MSDDKYVPEHEMVRECWIDWSAGCGIGRKTAYEEFDRFIAKVKADALREAAEDMDNTDDPDAIHIANGDADLWLKARAERIESGDGQ